MLEELALSCQTSGRPPFSLESAQWGRVLSPRRLLRPQPAALLCRRGSRYSDNGSSSAVLLRALLGNGEKESMST